MTVTLNQGSSERAPTLQEYVRRAIDAHMREHWKCMPAVVTSYDAATRKASCKILVKNPYLDEEDARQIESIPVISGVPVQFPGTGQLELTYPISDGNLIIDGQVIAATTGTLKFTDRSLDRWLSGDGAEVDPEIDHFHGKMDAVFEPGLYSFSGVPQASPTDAVHVGTVEGSKAVALDQDQVDCGSLVVVLGSGGPPPSFTVSVSYQPPGGGSPVVLLTLAALGTAGGGGTFPLSGLIQASAKQFKTQ